jgi:Na+/H+ antiporter NhaB
MFKNLTTTWWGVTILLITNLYIVDLFSEYIISREVVKEVQIVLTLGVLVSSIYVIKLLVNFIYNNLKEKKDD